MRSFLLFVQAGLQFLSILLFVLLVELILSGCSTANNWKPYTPSPEAPHIKVCVQRGSKLYDRDTGEECLSREQQRRKDAQTVHHAGAPR